MAPKLYPKPPADVPTYPSAALGIRSWRVSRTGEPLRAAYFDGGHSAWVPGVTRAHCESCPRVPNTVWDDSDHEAHRCGLHAYHSLEDLLAEQKYDVVQLTTGDQAIGIVAGRGNLEVHTAGWRAAEAQVLGLLAPPRPRLCVCPWCEDSPGLRPGCKGCRGMGRVAGAAGDEEFMVASPYDEEAARERVEAIAAHHGVRVFDTVEQMMEFGRGLASPCPEDLRVPKTPVWATRWFENSALLGWLFGVTALVTTMILLAVAGIVTIAEGGRHGMVVYGATPVCGVLGLLGASGGIVAWGVEIALKRHARRLWRAFLNA